MPSTGDPDRKGASVHRDGCGTQRMPSSVLDSLKSGKPDLKDKPGHDSWTR